MIRFVVNPKSGEVRHCVGTEADWRTIAFDLRAAAGQYRDSALAVKEGSPQLYEQLTRQAERSLELALAIESAVGT